MWIKKFIKIQYSFFLVLAKKFFIFLKHQKSIRLIKDLIAARNEIFVEVGAGDKKGTGDWVTIDMTQNCDIYWDLRNGIPFPNESISKIYSSHFLEHLSYKECQKFLDECKRVLKVGGAISLCVPNARLYIEAYFHNKSLDSEKFLSFKPAYNHTTKIDYVNYMAYMDGHHKYMFDEDNLIYILTLNGFRNAHSRPFDPTLDLQVRDLESIYAEAEK